MEENKEQLTEITIDGNKVSKEQLEEMMKKNGVRLKEIAPNTYKTLTLLHG